MIRNLILVIWAVILNWFVFPFMLYGADLAPVSWDKNYAVQIFLAIFSAIYLSAILDWMEKE